MRLGKLCAEAGGVALTRVQLARGVDQAQTTSVNFGHSKSDSAYAPSPMPLGIREVSACVALPRLVLVLH